MSFFSFIHKEKRGEVISTAFQVGVGRRRSCVYTVVHVASEKLGR